jgi:peptide/nickel transport system ATP-binding protein
MSDAIVLDIRNLTMNYTTRKGAVHAVENVSLSIRKGESLGLVGESGCGKSSLVLCILRTLPDNARILGGHILLDGTDLVPLPEEQIRTYRWRRTSMVFQGAMSSFNPVYRVGDQITEAITTHEKTPLRQAEERVRKLFQMVDLDPALMSRYPHELSGGMKQRAVIAMALACNPALVIADEPTTALDVIVQDRILRQLQKVQRETGTSMLYISHDIAVIAEVCERIGVMYAGKLVELTGALELFEHPLHPYTAALMSAFPSIAGEKHSLTALPGEPPNLLQPPKGCRFHPRCPYATDECSEKEPGFEEYHPDHRVACWHPFVGHSGDKR